MKWKIIWVLWGVFFSIVEWLAVKRKEADDTLSEFTWGILRVHRVIYFSVAGALVWLVLHLLCFGCV